MRTGLDEAAGAGFSEVGLVRDDALDACCIPPGTGDRPALLLRLRASDVVRCSLGSEVLGQLRPCAIGLAGRSSAENRLHKVSSLLVDDQRTRDRLPAIVGRPSALVAEGRCSPMRPLCPRSCIDGHSPIPLSRGRGTTPRSCRSTARPSCRWSKAGRRRCPDRQGSSHPPAPLL
jgi:hypothetical protein